MEISSKRKADDGAGNTAKRKKQWRTPKKGQSSNDRIPLSINAGDAGIWVTCDMHREGGCVAECQDLFNEYAKLLYGDSSHGTVKENPSKEIATKDEIEEPSGEVDIEKEINEEITGLKEAKKEALFRPVKIDVQCVLFFKVREPVDPVSFVHRICFDASESARTKTSRWIKRLTPMSRMGKATEKGLEEVSKIVLAPVFHTEDATPLKFAIRTTIRNNNIMKRDDVIKQVADAVGPRHSVDLKNYDRLVLVDVYRNILGMSVVNSDFEKLKRFNLAEIYDPTPKPEC